MAQYRKKPVVIEARQWDGSVESCVSITEAQEYKDMVWDMRRDGQKVVSFEILTLEGVYIVSPGDFIIKGVKGEFYPCKPDIFEATYEAVQDFVKSH